MIETFQNIQWQQPVWFFLVLVPVVFSFLQRILQTKRINDAYADRHLHAWAISGNTNNTGWFKTVLLQSITWLFLGAALANPVIEKSNESQTPDDAGVDIYAILDLSPSMHAADTQPSRLKQALLKLELLSSRLHKNDRLGVTLFSARPHLYFTATTDKNTRRFYIQKINSKLAPTTGSNISDAINLTVQHINQHKSDSRTTAILLISDGESGTETNPLSTGGIPLYCLGTGTTDGASIPYEDSWLKTQDDIPVHTKLNTHYLKSLATNNTGRYIQASIDDRDIRSLYENEIAKLKTAATTNTLSLNSWEQYYSIPLILFIILLLFGNMLLIALTKVFKIIRKSETSAIQVNLVVMYFCILLLMQSSISHADNKADKEIRFSMAVTLYQEEQYAQAAKYFDQLQGYKSAMGSAVSHFKSNNMSAAKSSFIRAILLANTDQQRANAIYNLAAISFNQAKYESAANYFKQVTNYQPANTTAKAYSLLASALHESIVFQQNKQSQLSNRSSSGKQLKSLKNLEASGTGKVDLSDVDEREIIQSLSSELSLTNDQYTLLLERGLKNIQIADNTIDDITQNTQYDIQESSVYTTEEELIIRVQQQQSSVLWQRIFELEEGFPALLDKPEAIQGIKPW